MSSQKVRLPTYVLGVFDILVTYYGNYALAR